MEDDDININSLDVRILSNSPKSCVHFIRMSGQPLPLDVNVS